MRNTACWSLTVALSLALVAALTSGGCAQAETVWLSSLDLSRATQDWGEPQRDLSVEKHPLSIAGRKFEKGFGTHAVSEFAIDLSGGSDRFTAWVGVDDEPSGGVGSVQFFVFGDGKKLWESPIVHGGEAARQVDVDVKGIKLLVLQVGAGGEGISYDHADWADAKFEVSGAKPAAATAPKEEPVVLTPKASPKPRINGAKVFGVRPNRPFFFKVAATGTKPLQYAAEGLPRRLTIDPQTGLITGHIGRVGTYIVRLRVSNKLGSASRDLRIEVGEKISLTPPMGWNSWNCWAGAVDADKVRRAAKAMVASGLIDHGWTYVNIDDTWQDKRGGPFTAIQGNGKFPDMKGLCDEIHAMGLKPGIYSTPWMTSYGGCVGGSSNSPSGEWRHEGGHGKYGFEPNDARQWAEWGFDYLKYDWNPNDVPHVQAMAEALRHSGRDIVYSLSNSAPFENASDWVQLANCWRTTGDIGDSWGSMSGIGFSQDRWVPFGGPGHWNDPDMLVVGYVGWGPNLHPTRLTPNEQYTHISLWCLLSAPLLMGCDLERLDPFTLGLLTNDEVLEVSQDPLGKEAWRVARQANTEVWAKTLEDGSRAVGLFNRGQMATTVSVKWSDMGLHGKHHVRDLWRQKDLGLADGEFKAEVPRHGVVLVKISE
jgi:alpha-galactosidase